MSGRSGAFGVLVLAMAAAGLAGADEPKEQDMKRKAVSLYVATDGSDKWTGRLAAPAPDGADGPFATITRARDEIRRMKKAGKLDAPVTVHLRGGRHELADTLVLGPRDSGTAECPITYAAYRDEQPILSGGRRVSGWSRGEAGRWEAPLPGVREGTWRFGQLFVNGERRFRPRLPKRGFYRVAGFAGTETAGDYRKPMDKFEFADGNMRADWKNLTDTEVVALHFWVDVHLPVASVDANQRIVRFTHASERRLTDDFSGRGARYYVDNVLEAMGPGQWYLDRPAGKLYYTPAAKEPMDTAEIIAPRLTCLLRLEGDWKSGRLVEHVRFRGLTFSHTDWRLPPGDGGDHQAAVTVPGAVQMTGARHCAIELCRLVHLGTYAVHLAEGCGGIRIVGNEMADLGGGGVHASGGDATSPQAARTGGNVFTDNEIHHIGQIYHSAVGFLLRHTADNVVAHNRIHHTYYTGISVGWVWGYKPSVSVNNWVGFNHIHHIGQGLLSDMGGIYTLGISPGTVLLNNVIHDVDSSGYGGWGLYTDEGSTGIVMENNIVYRTKTGGFHQHYGRENVLRNNIFALSKLAQLQRTRAEEHLSFTFERNIVYWREGPLLSKNWQGAETGKVKMDHNLYFDATGKEVHFARRTLDQWRQLGQDTHSQVADPKFADPDSGDFTLKPGSPALKQGFVPIDTTNVGPRR